MKFELGKNEAFIKLNINEENKLNVTYAFDVDPITEEEANQETLTDDGMSRLLCISMFAGLVTVAKHYAETIIGIGEEAIASGDFDVESEMSVKLFDFMEGLSEEDQELMAAKPLGEA